MIILKYVRIMNARKIVSEIFFKKELNFKLFQKINDNLKKNYFSKKKYLEKVF